MSRSAHRLALVSTALLALLLATPGRADELSPQQQFARDIYKQLVEIDTTTATGDTLAAAQAMAARLKAAGFADENVHVFSPAPRKDERVPVTSFYRGEEYLYRLVKMLSGGTS